MRNSIDNPPLRVLISAHLPPPMGGIAAYFEAVMNSSLKDKVNLQFVQSSSQTRSFSESGKATPANVKSALSDITRFRKAVSTFHPDIAHIATAFGLSFLKHGLCVLIARIYGCRVLLHPHCSFSVLYKERSGLWKWMVRRVVGMTDGILALSSEWLELEDACQSPQVFVLHNAIDLQPYRQIAMARIAETDHKSMTDILYLGHLGQAKGTFLLIEVAKILQYSDLDFRFHLVGEELGPGELHLLERAVIENDVQERVEIHPPVYGEEKLDQFRNADIFIYPSFHEGTPVAVLEALACGLPIIATRVGGLPDLVADGFTGFLVPPGDVEQLAKAISRLMENGELRKSMQQACLRTASDRYDIEDHIRKLIHIYKTVTTPASTAGQGR